MRAPNAILVDGTGNTCARYFAYFPPEYDVPLPQPVRVTVITDEELLRGPERLPVARFRPSHVENDCAFYYYAGIAHR